MLNLMSMDFFECFRNIIIFVFFRSIFSLHLSQYKESAFKQYCHAVFDLDRIFKSSAYKSEFMFFPCGRTNRSNNVFSNECGRLFKLIGTPLDYEKGRVLFCFVFVFVLFNTRFVSNLNYFRPRVSTTLGKTSFKFSAPRIWETVPPGLKCLPYHKFEKE